MTKREERTIKAFENCIEKGTYSIDYAITLIEDNKRYGWLSDEAKDEFYEWLDAYEEALAQKEAEEEARRLEEEAKRLEEEAMAESTEEVAEEIIEPTEE